MEPSRVEEVKKSHTVGDRDVQPHQPSTLKKSREVNKRLHHPRVRIHHWTLQKMTRLTNKKIKKKQNRPKKQTTITICRTRDLAKNLFHPNNKYGKTMKKTESCKWKTKAKTKSHLLLKRGITNENVSRILRRSSWPFDNTDKIPFFYRIGWKAAIRIGMTLSHMVHW